MLYEYETTVSSSETACKRFMRWLLFLYQKGGDIMAKYKKRSDGRYTTTVTLGHDPTDTRAMCNNTINKHIIPAMGHIPLDKIKKSDAQRMINKRWDHPRTCQIIRMTLIQILDTAKEDELINENVCRKLNMPKNEPAEKRQSAHKIHAEAYVGQHHKENE